MAQVWTQQKLKSKTYTLCRHTDQPRESRNHSAFSRTDSERWFHTRVHKSRSDEHIIFPSVPAFTNTVVSLLTKIPSHNPPPPAPVASHSAFTFSGTPLAQPQMLFSDISTGILTGRNSGM